MRDDTLCVWLVCDRLQLRRFRTMSELLLDAKQWAKHPWNAFGKKVVSTYSDQLLLAQWCYGYSIGRTIER